MAAKDPDHGQVGKLVFLKQQLVTYHPQAPDPQQTRARRIEYGEASGVGGIVRDERAQERERRDGHDERVGFRALVIALRHSGCCCWGWNLQRKFNLTLGGLGRFR